MHVGYRLGLVDYFATPAYYLDQGFEVEEMQMFQLAIVSVSASVRLSLIRV